MSASPPSPLNQWIPGALSNKQIKQLCKPGWIEDVINDGQIGYSALDLTLTSEGYHMLQGCIKPFGESYEAVLQNRKFAKPLPKKESFTLRDKETYVFKIKQHFGPKFLNSKALYGQATAKSSVGRVDVLARLIVDGMKSYEEYTPQPGSEGTGQMFLEITPITFSVQVKPDYPLSQLRIFYGDPKDCEISGKELYGSVLSGGEFTDGSLSVDLSDTELLPGQSGCAFRAIPKKRTAINLWKEKTKKSRPDPRRFWELLSADELTLDTNSRKYLEIHKEDFYILRSNEKISLPGSIAVYCRAIDETIGEMRIHYAGFVHPLFGRERSDNKQGTPLIFEVRGHDVAVSLTDGERMARLTFYRMSDVCKKEKKREIKKSGYEEQTLQLSGFFGSWS